MSALSIQLFGGLRVTRGGQRVKLPQSKKTRALLAYLVATGKAHRRDRLCSLFWDVADDPRAGLRWSLSKIRKLVNDDVERIVTDGDTVAFAANDAVIDYDTLCTAPFETLDLEQARLLVLSGDFLEGLELDDFFDFKAWLVATRSEVRRLQQRLLDQTLATLSLEDERGVSLARHAIHLAPNDTGAHLGLLKRLATTGRRQEAEQQYRMALDQLSDAGVVTRKLSDAYDALFDEPPPPRSIAILPEPVAKAKPARQEVRFCTAKDGTRLAYAVSGKGPPVLKAANWLSHLEYDWQSPVWGHIINFFSERNTFVRFDMRGSGLSHQNLVGEFGLDEFVADLEAVADATGHEKFILLGISAGTAACVEFACRYPERVAGLILYGGFAKGWGLRAKERGLAQGQAINTLIRAGWGADNPAFRQIFTSLFLPGGTKEQVDFFNELQRVSATPENAVKIREATSTMDVSGRLAEVAVPTKVLHVVDDAVARYKHGRELAMGIPNASFVSLEGENHLVLEDDPGWRRFSEEIRHFIDEHLPS